MSLVNDYQERKAKGLEAGLEVNWVKIESIDDTPKHRGTYLVIPKGATEYNPVDGTFYMFNAEYRREQMAKEFSYWAEFPLLDNPII